MTAKQLLEELQKAGCEPGADDFALVFVTAPPDHLAPYLEVLHTGVRALITGKKWHGFDVDTGKSCGPLPACGHGQLAHGALDPSRLIPGNASFLCAESDECWDRIHPFARLDVSDAFAPVAEPKAKPNRKAV